METSKQIEALEKAYMMIETQEVTGLGFCLNDILYNHTSAGDYTTEISWSIPTFNKKHVAELFDEYGIRPAPETYAGGYWWNMYEKEPRLKALVLLIMELEVNL